MRLARKSRTRTTILGLATVAMLAVPAAAHAVDVEPYGTCGGSYNPDVYGGEAQWHLECSGGEITIEGWVKDTQADGECARVTAYFSDGDVEIWKARPKGTVTHFEETGPGSLIDAYLTVT